MNAVSHVTGNEMNFLNNLVLRSKHIEYKKACTNLGSKVDNLQVGQFHPTSSASSGFPINQTLKKFSFIQTEAFRRARNIDHVRYFIHYFHTKTHKQTYYRSPVGYGVNAPTTRVKTKAKFAKPFRPIRNLLCPSHIGVYIRVVTILTLALLFLWLPMSCLLPEHAMAAKSATSIAVSNLGQKIATALRASGFPDEAVVFLLSTLPVLELRGAIPVAYWMNLEPVKAFALAVLGNMVPVPTILLLLGPLSEQASKSTGFLKNTLEWVLDTTRKKAAPIEEFEWLGLMLFVAVPLPGTGAWSGAIAAFILGMPFWSAISANFVGVCFAGMIMNMLCQLGIKWGALFGVGIFIASTFVWGFLRWLRKVSSVDKL